MKKTSLAFNLAEKRLRERVTKDVSNEMEELNLEVYKRLWNGEPDATYVIESPLKDSIMIEDGRISFDSGKTFIHRSEEKLIKDNIDKLEKDIIDFICEDVISTANVEISKIKDEDSVEKKREDKEDMVDDVLDELRKLPISEDSLKKFALLQELSVIDEQIDILKEMEGGRDRILSLLEEKHKIIKKLNEKLL